MAEDLSKSTNNAIDNIPNAQADMRAAFADGGSGVLASGLVWLVAAFIAHQIDPKKAIWALFIGGMFIFPLSILISKIIGLRGANTKGNQLAKLALEGTFFMIMCLPLAFGLASQKTEWFFLAMLLIIGGRYLTFTTIYGLKLYWILGAIFGISAYFLFKFDVGSFGILLTGAGVEISIGTYLLVNFFRKNK